ncbi:zinc-binding alcohol dehydrogenase family protein [Kaistia dalseonensis]|uniref:2-desacetyl-2-hydroxyethyl bacteriochlorophyllide A dehydrogenase n=1 Tax=Kaistia dalseonensis TaxID=410840 RepID=A0ABU0H9S6_9HYPH|nr:zinc-binding alcohol dehydrogenase family protein [Kaistia dalseonensis]MCX5496138.1 zinc-binding alcohol dehydrogenase family protein [Kaistia dalseonensis]MDQ0438747.1 2-desacetyl-2-hydroxyethyl bacteriochlorophyllide A dehydrogenase [Kaistia dalseonensis]
MKALRCDEPGKLSIIDRDKPVAGTGEVLVRIRNVGICGTDYHIFHGNQPYLDYPRVIGHELGGEVVSAPAGSTLHIGQTVSIEPYIYCGHCRACRLGRTNCCQNLAVLGVHKDGGACDYVVVPERNVVPADGLSTREAAMVEFLAIGAHGVRRSGATAQSRVAIVGAGPIGISAAVFCKARGADVSVIDRNTRRLAFCESELGVDRVFEGSDDIRERLAKATDGEFYDIVIDATGSPAAMQAGFAYVGHGGSYVLLSIVRADITFNDPEFHKRETTLLGSRNATRADFETVLDAMRTGKVPTEALATHAGALVDAPGLIPGWSKPESGVIKAILEV